MSFAELRSACDRFRTLLRDTTGREIVNIVSVDEPKEPMDELHFVKLVSWCYVFVFEASQPAVRHIESLIRAANPGDHKAIRTTFENVNSLRTVQVHNLSPASRSDDYKMRRARIWLTQNGGNPTDWPRCCHSLCEQMTSAVLCLLQKWAQVTANKEDKASAIQEMLVAIDREWPPHAFDRLIENAAAAIGLSGLDCVKYRESRLVRWRELVGFFEVRERAEAAMSTAIRIELEQLFGKH